MSRRAGIFAAVVLAAFGFTASFSIWVVTRNSDRRIEHEQQRADKQLAAAQLASCRRGNVIRAELNRLEHHLVIPLVNCPLVVQADMRKEGNP